MATRQPQKHPQYGVDSTGTTVTMPGNAEELLGRLIVGRTQFRRSQSGGATRNRLRQRRRGTPITYVRAPDQPDVYSIEQSLRSVTSRSVEDWRDKQMWGLSDGTQRSLRLRPASNDRQYLAVADDFPYVAELQKDRWDRSVLKGRSALLSGD